MPKITQVGVPSDANAILGGVPTLFYYDFASKGRGEVLRLFFEEAGIAFIDHRWSFQERNHEFTLAERAQINPVGSVPYLEMNGKVLTQSYPILRYFARKLGKYDGKTSEEQYLVDQFCDLALDWRTKFVDSAFIDTKDEGLHGNPDASPFATHKAFNTVKYVQGIEGNLAKTGHAGPFILGSDITYADLVIYQIWSDENKIGGINITAAPRLTALVSAVEQTPNIKAYMASDRYYH